MKRNTARTSILALVVAAAPVLAASGVELAFAQAANPPAAPAARPVTQGAAAQTNPPQVAATAETESDIRASALVGTNIYNAQNETVGEIEDIILDQSHKMKAVIVSVGGFLGLGSRYVAVAPEQIMMTRDGAKTMRITMNTTRDQMKQAPEFNYISGWRNRATDSTATSSTNPAVAPNAAATRNTGAATGSAPNSTATTSTGAPLSGANSFTEAQAKDRATGAGFTDIGPMQKDDKGVWHGQAKKDGKQVTVAVDYQGNVTQQ